MDAHPLHTNSTQVGSTQNAQGVRSRGMGAEERKGDGLNLLGHDAHHLPGGLVPWGAGQVQGGCAGCGAGAGSLTLMGHDAEAGGLPSTHRSSCSASTPCEP